MRSPRPLLVRLLVLATLSTTAGCPGYGMPFGRRIPPAASTICAFGIPGVRMCLRDTKDGVELTLVVVGDASELHRRAHAALAGTYPLRPSSKALMSRIHATLRDEPEGLVIDAVPVDPAQLESVRTDFHRLLEELQSGACE